MIKQKIKIKIKQNVLGVTVPYLEIFWAYRYMYWDQDFNKSIGERTVRQTNDSYGSI